MERGGAVKDGKTNLGVISVACIAEGVDENIWERVLVKWRTQDRAVRSPTFRADKRLVVWNSHH